MHNPESVLGNETHKLLWDFKIQTDHLISARKPDLKKQNKQKKKKKKNSNSSERPVDNTLVLSDGVI